MADAAARVGDVAGVAGDDVDVQVQDRLARGLARVETDVVAVGAKLRVERGFDDIDEREDGVLLVARRVEPRRDEAARTSPFS